MKPTSARPSATRPSETHQCAMPRTKLAVPSIGSTTHISRPLPPQAALLAEERILREVLGEEGEDQLLAFAVGLADEILQPLAVDLEFAAAAIEIERQRAGFANGRLRGLRPALLADRNPRKTLARCEE